ncbi:hypothetical protein CDD83_63 [Cordyceps sp. RAO-2017]|nr:hypothetical protein CDD83_63 [Cordyceps sp. RAO-2017]
MPVLPQRVGSEGTGTFSPTSPAAPLIEILSTLYFSTAPHPSCRALIGSPSAAPPPLRHGPGQGFGFESFDHLSIWHQRKRLSLSVHLRLRLPPAARSPPRPSRPIAMARGNQREKSREANLKKQAALKKGNNLSGTEMQRAKEQAADIMRQKQAAAEAKKAAATSSGK